MMALSAFGDITSGFGGIFRAGSGGTAAHFRPGAHGLGRRDGTRQVTMRSLYGASSTFAIGIVPMGCENLSG